MGAFFVSDKKKNKKKWVLSKILSVCAWGVLVLCMIFFSPYILCFCLCFFSVSP